MRSPGIGGADDLVQSTLVRALAKSHLWQPGTNLRRWLFTMLHNQRVSEVRHMVREQRALADERVAALSPASSDPSTRIALLELDRAIAVLPEARRQVVVDRPRRNVLRRGRRHPRGPGRYSAIPACTRAPYRSADREARLAVRRARYERIARVAPGVDRCRQCLAGASMEQTNSIRVGFAMAFFVMLAPAPSSAADLAAGELLADKWCGECHGIRRGRLGPN